MYWTDVDHSFCESSLTGLPEYYNAFSSLFIVLFGIKGLFNIYNELFVDILYTNLIIVGFGSFGYHWRGNIGWGLFDEIPMILAIFTGIIYTDNVHFLLCKNLYDKNESMIKNIIYKRKGKLFIYLFTMCLIIICNIMSNFRKLFPTVFGCVASYLYFKIFMLLKMITVNKDLITIKTYNSLKTIALSGSIWIFTELSCNYIKHPIFLIGHPMWHFFIGHGFYNLIQVVYFIKTNDTNYTLRYNQVYLLERYPPEVIE